MSLGDSTSPSGIIEYRRVIELSHTIHPLMPHWPGDPATTFETVANVSRDGYYLRRFRMGEHSATHINAPLAFFEQASSVDAMPIESLVVPAAVIDVRPQVQVNPGYVLTKSDLLRWEASHRQLPAGVLVLLCTGWDQRWRTPQAFLNRDGHGYPRFPAFGTDIVRFLLDERHVCGLGIDTHGVDEDDTYASNRLVLERGGIVLENLACLDQLPPIGSTLVIGRLKLAGGSGSPAAVTALVP
jgi:kynurenine formamidase